MRFIVERDALADGVMWVSRSLSARPIMPVLLGVLIKADKKGIHLSGYDLETSGKAEVTADVKEEGTVLVSGKLLSDIARALPNKPVTFSLEGNRVSVISGSAKFALPTLSVSDYPNLPELPSETGRLSGDLFAEAVSQVAIAAGKDDSLPVLTGVYVEIEENKLILAATDRYRLAVRELNWDAPRASASALIRARTLNDAAKSLAGAKSVSVALAAATATASSGTGQTINIGLPLGLCAAGTKTIPSGDTSYEPGVVLFAGETFNNPSSAAFLYWTNDGAAGLLTSYTMIPPMRSSPTKANV